MIDLNKKELCVVVLLWLVVVSSLGFSAGCLVDFILNRPTYTVLLDSGEILKSKGKTYKYKNTECTCNEGAFYCDNEIVTLDNMELNLCLEIKTLGENRY